jgi:ABC-2 type transport system ATP-binding protein
MICGLIPPTAGSVHVDGISVAQRPNAVRARIGLLPEDAGDYKNLTLAEELAYHGAMYGLDAAMVRQRSRPLLDRLGLLDRANHRLKTFSRGMRRKFHLIRALLHQPRLLLLDEPTAGLDPSIVEEVWDLLKALAVEHQVTVVLCSHHLEEVERLCTRVAILRGRLLMEGSLAELAGGDNRYQLELHGEAAALEQSIGAIAGVAEARADGAILHFRVAGEAEQVIPEVVRCAVAGGGRVMGLSRNERDLRSLYRASIGTGEGSRNG